jgi:hypothetical protein
MQMYYASELNASANLKKNLKYSKNEPICDVWAQKKSIKIIDFKFYKWKNAKTIDMPQQVSRRH